MALEVAEGAVVRQHVEAVVDALERPPRLVPAVLPLADVRPDERQALGGAEPGDAVEQLLLGQVRVRVADRRQQLVLGVGVEVDERHGRRRRRGLVGEQRLDAAPPCAAGSSPGSVLQRTPRSATSTRRRKLGMTLRSSCSISSP